MIQAEVITTNDGLSVLNSRTKDLDSTHWGYKLTQGNQFGLDVPFAEDMELDESSMSVVIPFADGRGRDGVGDLLEVGGIRTERHQLNPIVLFDHGKSVQLPVALAEDPKTKEYTVFIDVPNQTAKGKAFFYQGTGTDLVTKEKEYQHALFCEQLYHLICKRYVRAGSIGYQVIKALNLQPNFETGIPQGLHLLSVLMLEFSAVVLPANGDTVRKVFAMPSICGKSLSPMLMKSLEPYASEKKAQLGYEGKSTEGEEKWITINGAHVLIDDDGNIVKGPENLVGKHKDEIVKSKTPSMPHGHNDWAKIAKTITDKQAKEIADNLLKHVNEESFTKQVNHQAGELAKEVTSGLAKRTDLLRARAALEIYQSDKANKAGQTRKGNAPPGGASAGHWVSEDDEKNAWHEAWEIGQGKKSQSEYEKKTMSAYSEMNGGALIGSASKKKKIPPVRWKPGVGAVKSAEHNFYTIGEYRKLHNISIADIVNLYRSGKVSLRQWEGFSKKPDESVTFAGDEFHFLKEVKSLDDIRKKYRPVQKLRHRMKNSSSGCSIIHVGYKDIEKARQLAEAKGVSFRHMNIADKNVHRVKLIGSDGAIDEVAKKFGLPMKMMKRGRKSPTVTGFKSLTIKGKSMEEDNISSQDEPESKEEKSSEEPYGAQVLRRIHEDHSILMEEYDEMLEPLEHESVKAHLQKQLENLENVLTETESLFEKAYDELPQIKSGEKNMDENEGEEESTDSNEEEEVSPEEAVEGMNTKSIEAVAASKELRMKYKSMKCLKCGKANCSCSKSMKVKSGVPGNEENQKKPGRQGKPIADDHNPGYEEFEGRQGKPGVQDPDHPDRDYGVEVGHDPGFEELDSGPGANSSSLTLKPHQKSHIQEAHGFLGEVAGTKDFHDGHRMEAYHHHRNLNSIGKPIAQIPNQVGADATGLKGFDQEDSQEDTAEIQEGDRPIGDPKNEHPHMKSIRAASAFFKDLAETKDFGDPHRQMAAHFKDELNPILHQDEDEMGLEKTDEDSEEAEVNAPTPGEMGEKKLAVLKKTFLQQKKEMDILNRKFTALAKV